VERKEVLIVFDVFIKLAVGRLPAEAAEVFTALFPGTEAPFALERNVIGFATWARARATGGVQPVVEKNVGVVVGDRAEAVQDLTAGAGWCLA
jgi:hypothetical protein